LQNINGVLAVIRENYLSHPPLNPLPSREGRQKEMLPSREGKVTHFCLCGHADRSREGRQAEMLPSRRGSFSSLSPCGRGLG